MVNNVFYNYLQAIAVKIKATNKYNNSDIL